MIDIGIPRMKRYLADAIECEKNVHIWSESMKRVNSEMEQLYRDQEKATAELQATQNRIDNLSIIYEEKTEKKASDIKRYIEASKKHKQRCFFMILLMPIIFLVWVVISFFLLIQSESIILTAGFLFYFLIYLEAAPVILFIISKKKIKKYTNKSITTKQTDLVIARENEETQLIKQKDKLVERCAWLIAAEQCVTDWQDEIHKSYKQALATREKLYSLNILDSCYQNFSCVTSFYEYIQTGRVDTVNGVGGLANTLTLDKRLIDITSGLNDLCAIGECTNTKLHYLAEQATEANNIRRQINDQISSLNNNVGVLSDHQSRTADAANRIDSQLRYGY